MTNTAGTIIVIALLSCAAPGIAGSNPSLWWHLQPVGADSTARGEEYRYYGSQTELAFTFILRSEDGIKPVIVDGSSLPRVILTVTRGRSEVPTIAEWGLSMRHAGEDRSQQLPASARVLLDPGDRIETAVVLRLKDGSPFEPGDYVVRIAVEPFIPTVLFDSGEAWTGRYERSGLIRLELRPPASVLERKRQLMTDASNARSRGDVQSAIEHYQRISELDPADWRAHAGLGLMLVEIGRFAEGVVALEKVLPFVAHEKSQVPMTLAYAHIALGNEVRARAVLGLVLPLGRIDGEIQRLRAVVGRRPRR